MSIVFMCFLTGVATAAVCGYLAAAPVANTAAAMRRDRLIAVALLLFLAAVVVGLANAPALLHALPRR